MNTATSADPWAINDHDPLSQAEHTITGPVKTYAARAMSGAIIVEYPDFIAGAPLRALPAIVSNAFPTDRRIVDDNWIFVGPTRHAEYAHIGHERDHVTVAIERHRLRPRPDSYDLDGPVPDTPALTSANQTPHRTENTA